MTARLPVALLLPWTLAAAGAQEVPEVPRYGRTPEELVPYRRAEPYAIFFTEPPQFRGPGREAPEPEGLTEVALGVLLPFEGRHAAAGRRLRAGVELALAEANREGGLRGLPFTAVYRDESRAWGASANAAVELAFDDRVWALIGALDDSASHVLSRVLLKVELPVVNTNGTDPTLTEHAIPWMVRVRPDDRRNAYRLARKIFVEDGRRRVAVLRANDRYARMGIGELVDAARRLGSPILLEVRFENHDTVFDAQLERLRDVSPDAVVLWGHAAEAGRVLAALRAAGLAQPVYGPDRLLDPEFLAAAGAAAEGLVTTHPFDPENDRPEWSEFRRRYDQEHGEEPDAVAAYAYDGARYLIRALRAAGLNRVRLRDRLFAETEVAGVTGPIRFDVNHNNVSPIVLCQVRGGVFRCG